jgi:hypothetical protein
VAARGSKTNHLINFTVLLYSTVNQTLPWLQNLSMSLRKDLTSFQKKMKTRKEALTLRLSRMESISEADEQWLDHEANTVDEERVLHDLETASNYKRGLERLDEDGKAIVKKLREWAGDIMKVAGISQLDGDV